LDYESQANISFFDELMNSYDKINIPVLIIFVPSLYQGIDKKANNILLQQFELISTLNKEINNNKEKMSSLKKELNDHKEIIKKMMEEIKLLKDSLKQDYQNNTK